MKYRQRLVFWVVAIFIVFSFATVFIAMYNHNEDKKNILKARMECYADLVANSPTVQYARQALPEEIRITVMDLLGIVISDTEAMAMEMDDHYGRPEIQKCLEEGDCYLKRYSTTLGADYVYYAKKYEHVIIRISQLYGKAQKRFMRPDWSLIVGLWLLFAISLLAIIYLNGRYKRLELMKNERDVRRLKHEMTRNISHELKTPVSSLQAYIETLTNRPDLDEDRRQLFLERAYVQSLKLSEIISDISTLTKFEECSNQFAVSDINLRTLFCEVMDELSRPLYFEGITVDNRLPEVSIRSNSILLHSIFANLVENTIKYAGAGSLITVSYELLRSGLHCIEYTDNGKGVTDEVLERIFERFFQGESGRSGGKLGSGLGLSIVKNAVIAHKGEISAYHLEGGGLGFRFTLSDLDS